VIALATLACGCALALAGPPEGGLPAAPVASSVTVVTGGIERDGAWARKPEALRSIDGALVVEGARTVLWAPVELGRGNFAATFELLVPELAASGAGIRIDSSVFGIDGPSGQLYTSGPLFSGGVTPVADSVGKVRAGVPLEVRVVRDGDALECLVNGERVVRASAGEAPIGRIGVWGGRGAVAVGSFSVDGSAVRARPADVVWSAGGEVWDEVALPSVAALADGSLLVAGSAVRSDEQGKDVRRIVVRARDPKGAWSASRVAGPEELAGSDSALIADGTTVHLVVQAPTGLKVMRSGDGGVSWSAPADIGLPSPRSQLAGHGIRVAHAGKAILCVPVTVPMDGGARSVALVRSSDGGASWTAGAPVVEACAAPAIADLGEGRLAMIGVRPQMAGRWMWISADAGSTWGAPMACGGLDPGTMRACVWRQPDGALMLVESARRVPNALRRWRSDDGGASWIEQLPVQMTPAGACAVAVAPEGTAWIAHEGGDFARREHVLVRTLQ
jgi:hypothetical protein